MLSNFPQNSLKVLGNVANYTKREVLAASNAIIAYASELEQEVINGDIVIPADYVAQLDKYVEAGLDQYLPAWIVQLAINKLNSYLLPKK